MAGIGVVLNPKSRHNLRNPDAASRLSRLLGDGGVVRVAHSIDELRRIAEDFRALDVDFLAIAGGDGTNHVTLTGFFEVYGDKPIPPVALLRGGTMNTVANSVGVARQSSERLLVRLMDPKVLQQTERNVLRIAPKGAGEVQHGFLFGTGVVHGFLAEYYRGGNPTPLVAATTLTRGIASALVAGATIRRIAEPFRGSVLLEDGAVWEERDYLAVALGTIAHIGLEFKPFHRYGERADAFHVLGIHASPLELVRELPRIWRGRPMRPGRAREALASRIVVRSAGVALRYMVDGDLHEAEGELTVSTGPRIRLVVVR
jgi:diacylglycerol kinase family enzyme